MASLAYDAMTVGMTVWWRSRARGGDSVRRVEVDAWPIRPRT